MKNTRKITTFTLVLIMPISLISGYFCFTPQTALAANMSVITDMTNCQGMVQAEHYMVSNDNSGAVPPCCLKKNDNNSQSGAINLNNLSPDSVNQQSTSEIQIINNDSIDHSNSFDYPISPTQTGISSSIILIE